MSFRKFMEKNKVVIILRSLPGAGKTYKAKQLLVKFGGDENHIFSADKYFEHVAEREFIEKYGRKPNDKELQVGYKKVWNPRSLGTAHRYCFEEFKKAVDLGINPAIVDNTNTTKSQFERYCKYAEDNDYRIRIEEPESPWWKEAREDLGNTKIKYSNKLKQLKKDLIEHGTHGVPADVIENLIDNVWQNIPGGYNRYVKYDDIFKKDK